MRKKSKKRVFQCVGYESCNMTFTRSEHLARHIRKHTGERPFQCDFCQKHFSRLDNLRQHKQTVHAFQTNIETPNTIKVKTSLGSSSSVSSFSSSSSTSSGNCSIIRGVNNNNSAYAKIDSSGPMRNLYITEAPPMLSPNSLHRSSSIFNATQLSGTASQFSSFTKTPQFRSTVANNIPPPPSFASYNSSIPNTADASDASSMTRKRPRPLNLPGSDYYRHSNGMYTSSEPSFQNSHNDNISNKSSMLNNGYMQTYASSAPISTTSFDSVSIYSDKSASNISSHSNNSNSQLFGTRESVSSQPSFQQPSNITTPKPIASNSPVNSPFQGKFTPSQPSSPSLSNLSSNFDSLKTVNNSMSSEISSRSSISLLSYKSGSVSKQNVYDKHLPALPMVFPNENNNTPKMSAYQQAQLSDTSKKLAKINNYTNNHKRLSENSSTSSSWLRSVMNSSNSIHGSHHQHPHHYHHHSQQHSRNSFNSINSALHNSNGQNNVNGPTSHGDIQQHDDDRRMSIKSDFSLNSSLSNGSFSRVSLAFPSTEIIKNSEEKPNLPSLVNNANMDNPENGRKLPGLSSLRLDRISIDTTVHKAPSIQNLLTNPTQEQKPIEPSFQETAILEHAQRPAEQPQLPSLQQQSQIQPINEVSMHSGGFDMQMTEAEKSSLQGDASQVGPMPSIIETSVRTKPYTVTAAPPVVSPNSSHAYHGNILPPIRINSSEQNDESFFKNQMKYRNSNLPSMSSSSNTEQDYNTRYMLE